MNRFEHNDGASFCVDGASIFFEEAGNKAGEPILLLHGGFGTLEDFEPIATALSKDFRLIAMDARGQGKSTLGDKPLTYQLMKEDAEKLLDLHHIKSATIIGFSDGGMVAHLMAIENPDRVKKLVSIAAPWRKPDLDLIREFLMKVTPESWKDKFPESFELYQRLNPEVDFKILTKQLVSMWIDESETGGYPGDLVKQITCPTLVIRGDDDHLFSRESASLLAGSVEKSSLLNLPFGEHEIHKEQAEIVSNFIIDFLKKDCK